MGNHPSRSRQRNQENAAGPAGSQQYPPPSIYNTPQPVLIQLLPTSRTQISAFLRDRSTSADTHHSFNNCYTTASISANLARTSRYEYYFGDGMTQLKVVCLPLYRARLRSTLRSSLQTIPTYRNGVHKTHSIPGYPPPPPPPPPFFPQTLIHNTACYLF